MKPGCFLQQFLFFFFFPLLASKSQRLHEELFSEMVQRSSGKFQHLWDSPLPAMNNPALCFCGSSSILAIRSTLEALESLHEAIFLLM